MLSTSNNPWRKGEINHIRMRGYLWNGGCSLHCFSTASGVSGIHVIPPHYPSFRHFRGSPTATSIPKHLYLATVGHTHLWLAFCLTTLLPSVLQNTDSVYSTTHECTLPLKFLEFPPDILLFNLQAKSCFAGHLAPCLNNKV